MTEKWRPVLDYETKYSVSSCGKVKNSHSGKILKQRLCRIGYARHNLYSNGQIQTFKVHRLVAEAFLGRRPINWVINHKDGNKLNNDILNLEYVTCQENATHAMNTGLLKPPSGDSHFLRKNPERRLRGSRHGGSKLKENDIISIRERLLLGESQSTIAKAFHVSAAMISCIALGKNWTHVI